MSNATNGEFTIEIGGDPFTFKIGVAAIIAAQERIGQETGTVPSVQELLDEFVRMRRMLYVRTLLWAGLRKHHPHVSLADAEELMDQLNVEAVQGLVRGLALSTQPAPKDLQAVQSTDPPPALGLRPKRVRPNGRPRSTPKRGASA